jgi:hypothetical protein
MRAILLIAIAAGCDGTSHEDACGVDLVCPARIPAIGSPCEGELECSYPELDVCPGEDAVCVDGAWSWSCLLENPMLAEYCESPQPVEAGTVELEVSEELMWGTQGLAMVSYELRVEPGESAPSCVRVQNALTMNGMTVMPETYLVARCGVVDRALVILPENPCEARPYEITLSVEVDGAAPIERTFTVQGGPPDEPPSPCP